MPVPPKLKDKSCLPLVPNLLKPAFRQQDVPGFVVAVAMYLVSRFHGADHPATAAAFCRLVAAFGHLRLSRLVVACIQGVRSPQIDLLERSRPIVLHV